MAFPGLVRANNLSDVVDKEKVWDNLGNNISIEFPSWTPAAITTALWLDAADSSTITESGGAVSQWNDKSGNARHVSQADSARRPQYQSTGFNGRPTIDFDGSNDFLKNAAFQPAGAFTCFFVFNRDVAGGVFVNAQRAEGIFETNGIFSAGYTNITFIATGAGTGQGFNIADGGTEQNIILGVQYDGSGSSAADFVARLNGVNQSIVNSGALGFAAETGFTVGARAVQGLGFYDGRMSEIVFVQSQTSPTDTEKIEGYLAHKWGLTANLPVNHPYRTFPPPIEL